MVKKIIKLLSVLTLIIIYLRYWPHIKVKQVLIYLGYCGQQPDIYRLLKQSSTRPPSINKSLPLDVKIGMYLESLGNFRSTEMSFDVDLYIYMSWRDIRLSHNFSDYVLINNDEIRKQVWLPDLYFANARQASFQEVTIPNFNLFVAPDGTIAYSCRCTLTVACSLNLRFYPMDQQICSIRVLSYAYIAKQVNVTWFETNPIRYNEEIGLPEFKIDHVSKGYCNGSYQYALTANSFKADNFSCLTGNLYLSRSIGYNLVQSYIPTGLIVMISWVSFWIDRRAVPARVTLSFTTLVSLTTLGNGLRFGLPQVSYAKAIDLWYGACMFFVFCALLEFATINSYMRRSEKFDSMGKKIQSVVLTGRRNDDDDERAGQKRVIEIPAKSYLMRGIKESMRIAGGAAGNFIDTLDQDEWSSPIDRGRLKQRSPRNYSKQDSVQDILSERIKFIDNEFDLDAKEDEAGMAMSIYDNVSYRKGEPDQYNDDSKYDPKRKLNGNRGAAENNMSSSQTAQNDSLIAATYFQISSNFSRQALNIDKTCRYCFPLTFLLWNIFYWWYYLVYTKVPLDFET